MKKRSSVIFVFADQWRAQTAGYAGDPNVKTPYLDWLAGQSINFNNAVSGMEYMRRWNYPMDDSGAVPYRD